MPWQSGITQAHATTTKCLAAVAVSARAAPLAREGEYGERQVVGRRALLFSRLSSAAAYPARERRTHRCPAKVLPFAAP
jgi:hypothetical protein